MATIDLFITDIFKKEGGFQNDKQDNGNWTGGKTGVGTLVGTNLGITAPVLAKWRGVKPSTITEEDIKKITKEEAKAIYEKKYLIDTGINKLPENVQGNVLDMAINAGPSRAIKLFQEAAGMEPTGVVDDKTLVVAPKVDNNLYADRRNEFYKSLITANPTKYKKYEKGWLKRSDSFRTQPEPVQGIPEGMRDYEEKFSTYSDTPNISTADLRDYEEKLLTPQAAPEFNSMEELLQSKGVMPTSSAPPVSDTYRMEGYNAPYKQTTEPVNINTEPTGLENPLLSVKNWWNSL